MVTQDIVADMPVYAAEAPQEQARQIHGLRAVFGEKYPPKVRLVSIGMPVDDLLADPSRAEWAERSIEFCGGTHLASTGDAEGFVIVAEEAVAKGVRRITAQTGRLAHQTQAQGQKLLARLEALAGVEGETLEQGVAELTAAMEQHTLPSAMAARLRAGIAELQKTIKKQQKQQNQAAAGQVVEAARKLADEAEQAGRDMIIAAVDGCDAGGLRTAMDVIRKRLPDAAMLLAAVSDDKIAFLAAVPEAKIKAGLKAGDWVREVAKAAGGGGGGRPDMAQAGGKDPAKLTQALDAARQYAAAAMGK
jgi:alanyl-tRNA synthetase